MQSHLLHKLYKQTRNQKIGMETIILMQKEEEEKRVLKKTETKQSLEQKAEKKEAAKRQKETATKNNNNSEQIPTHNSLQHDPTISIPLLSVLVDALRKQNTQDIEEEIETLELIAKEAKKEETAEESLDKKKKKDSIVELAERIKSLYANELKEQMYSKSLQNYTANSMQYQNDTNLQQMQKGITAAYSQEDSESKEKIKVKAVDDESSTGYKASGGSKYQAFIMTDPKGRWHSTWEITRILSETYDGKIERNDGLHYQGL